MRRGRYGGKNVIRKRVKCDIRRRRERSVLIDDLRRSDDD